jgi:translation initiation factor IF-2
MPKETATTEIKRPPVVVIMGHIDHGKSTLLDYIRKTNVVDKEAGGITQKLSAYEVTHKDEHGENRKITFLDTPGHEAFSKMRARGTKTADIAILVVSAEDSVKAQTIEAWETIVASGIPYIVAINKIDRPGANIEKTKLDLTEKGIYLEGYGGDVPFAEISAKVGTNVNTLLDLIILVADLQNFTGDQTIPGKGVVIESHLDAKRGTAATLIIKNGTVKKGDFIVVEHSIVGTRILEDFKGASIESATFSSRSLVSMFHLQSEVNSKSIHPKN